MTITTQTPRNPNNPGAYALEDVAPAMRGSRFTDRPVNFEGHRAANGKAVADAYAELVAERVRQASPLVQEPKTVKLFFVSRDYDSGEVVRVTRGAVTRRPELEVARSGKFSKVKGEGGALLDSVLLDGADPRDEQIWDGLEALVTELGPRVTSETIRSLNDSISILVCLRAGIRIEKWDLPNVGATH